jgi:hypothetical protein
MSDRDDEDVVLLDQRKVKSYGKRYLERRPRGLRRFARTPIGKGDGADLPTVDLRTGIGMRYRELVLGMIADQGGLERLSAIALALIRRTAACITLAERCEANALEGKEFSRFDYALYCGVLIKTARLLGIARVPKEVESLGTLLARFNAEDREGGMNGATAEDDTGTEDDA